VKETYERQFHCTAPRGLFEITDTLSCSKQHHSRETAQSHSQLTHLISISILSSYQLYSLHFCVFLVSGLSRQQTKSTNCFLCPACLDSRRTVQTVSCVRPVSTADEKYKLLLVSGLSRQQTKSTNCYAHLKYISPVTLQSSSSLFSALCYRTSKLTVRVSDSQKHVDVAFFCDNAASPLPDASRNTETNQSRGADGEAPVFTLREVGWNCQSRHCQFKGGTSDEEGGELF
jgi:hypothetical protein